MAIRERVQQVLGIKPQVIAADDGIVLQIPVLEGRLPGAELVVFDPLEVSALVRGRIDETALFAARFRECAARALLMPTTRPGHRTPLWLQRVKAGQLLEAARQFQDFPVSVEAARECLQEYYDLPALTGLMERLGSGRVRVVEADTTEPSPFAHPLLFGTPAPCCTRRTCRMPSTGPGCCPWIPRCSTRCWGTEVLPSCSTTRSWRRWRPSFSTW